MINNERCKDCVYYAKKDNYCSYADLPSHMVSMCFNKEEQVDKKCIELLLEIKEE